MLRPLVAFAGLALGVFLLTPTVQSVHEAVEGLDVEQVLPWELWKRDRPDPIPTDPDCDRRTVKLHSEITQWPDRIQKDQPFTLAGRVVGEGEGGVAGVRVDLFLNETKDAPGLPLGTVVTTAGGGFSLAGRVPVEIVPQRYHLVAHAHGMGETCRTYLEHWSDPEMEITSRTDIVLQAPPQGVVGRPLRFSGRLLDALGAPAVGHEVVVRVAGRTSTVATDASGSFTVETTPEAVGNVTLQARFAGTRWYLPSRADLSVPVVDEAVLLDGPAGGALPFLRNRTTTLSGEVVVPPRREGPPLHVAVGDMPPQAVVPDANGSFRVDVVVPADATPGPTTLRITGGGLQRPFTREARILVPTHLALELAPDGPLAEGVHGTARLVDDRDAPVAAPFALETPVGWMTPGDAGAFAFGVPCGPVEVRAHFNGSADHAPAFSRAEATVCPFLAGLPAWLLATPWWAWPLAALLLGGAYLGARTLLDRQAPHISRGPPLDVRFTSPRDAAPGVVGVGEAAEATVYLEDALPAGFRLRVGTFGDMADATVDPDLRAQRVFVPSALGETPVRAEIVDTRGRVVTRRTAILRCVQYAEEIEARYRRLKRDAAQDESETVSPREFEAWLRARTPHVDPSVAARLVHVFEEADYSPREVGRPELLAYLAAEEGVTEVGPVA